VSVHKLSGELLVDLGKGMKWQIDYCFSDLVRFMSFLQNVYE